MALVAEKCGKNIILGERWHFVFWGFITVFSWWNSAPQDNGRKKFISPEIRKPHNNSRTRDVFQRFRSIFFQSSLKNDCFTNFLVQVKFHPLKHSSTLATNIGHVTSLHKLRQWSLSRRRFLLSETAIKFLGYLNYEFLEQFIYAYLSSRGALRDQRDLHVTLRKTLPKHSNSLLYHTKTSKQVSFIFNIHIIFSSSQKVNAIWAIFR